MLPGSLARLRQAKWCWGNVGTNHGIFASALHEDVEHLAVLVDCAPEGTQPAPDADEHLVQVPLVTGTWPASLQFVRKQPAEAQT